MEQEEQEKKIVQFKRPPGLTVACIFSLVYNGILLAIAVISFFYAEYILNVLSRAFETDTMTPLTGYLIMIGCAFLFLSTMLSVLLMWHLKITGFYLYIILKSILIILLISINYLNYFNLLLAIFMLLVYWSYRKRMQNSREPLHN